MSPCIYCITCLLYYVFAIGVWWDVYYLKKVISLITYTLHGNDLAAPQYPRLQILCQAHNIFLQITSPNSNSNKNFFVKPNTLVTPDDPEALQNMLQERTKEKDTNKLRHEINELFQPEKPEPSKSLLTQSSKSSTTVSKEHQNNSRSTDGQLANDRQTLTNKTEAATATSTTPSGNILLSYYSVIIQHYLFFIRTSLIDCNRSGRVVKALNLGSKGLELDLSWGLRWWK